MFEVEAILLIGSMRDCNTMLQFIFTRSWEPTDTTSDSEPEASVVAEKGSIEKTEKVINTLLF